MPCLEAPFVTYIGPQQGCAQKHENVKPQAPHLRYSKKIAMRYIVPLFLLLVVVGALVSIKGMQFKKLPRDEEKKSQDLKHKDSCAVDEEQPEKGPAPTIVHTEEVKQDTWEEVLSAVGTVTASKGVTISNEVPGIVETILFDSGAEVRPGQPLVILDSKVEHAQLESAKARMAQVEIDEKRSRVLVEKEAQARSFLETEEAKLKSARAEVSAIQAQIDRKTVCAPFAGRMGMRNVNLGQFLNSGTLVSVLESHDAVFVDFSLPQQNLKDVHVGDKVRVRSPIGDGTTYDSVISTIDPTVDASTRSIKMRASVTKSVAGMQQYLRPGMFVNVDVLLPSRKVMVIPAVAIMPSAFGDSVYVVKDKIAQQHFVQVGARHDNQVAIFTAIKPGQEGVNPEPEDVKPGQQVVTAGAFKLRHCQRVEIQNEDMAKRSVPSPTENR